MSDAVAAADHLESRRPKPCHPKTRFPETRFPKTRRGSRPELPVDSDIDDVAADRARSVHLRPGYLLVVGAGGAVGTAARALLTQAGANRDIGTGPSTLLINVAGSLFLGVLLELLVRLGPDHGRRRLVRLLVGTGFMGGFTTYSTLALGVAEGLRAGRWAGSVGYALASVALGLIACAAGIALAALRRHHTDRSISPGGGAS